MDARRVLGALAALLPLTAYSVADAAREGGEE